MPGSGSKQGTQGESRADILKDFDDLFFMSVSKENHSNWVQNEPAENTLKVKKEIKINNNGNSSFYTPGESLLSTRSLTLPRQSRIRKAKPDLKVRK